MVIISEEMIKSFKSKDVWSIVSRLVLGALVYLLWQERNARIVTKRIRTPIQLSEEIKQEVRLNIATLPWKNSRNVDLMKRLWLGT